jgi:hypothetical protein
MFYIKSVSISANFEKVNFPAITVHIFIAYNGKLMFIDRETEFYAADINNSGKTFIVMILLDAFSLLELYVGHRTFRDLALLDRPSDCCH